MKARVEKKKELESAGVVFERDLFVKNGKPHWMHIAWIDGHEVARHQCLGNLIDDVSNKLGG